MNEKMTDIYCFNIYKYFVMTYAILNISDSDKHRSSAIWEYEKRLWKSVILDEMKPCKIWTREQIIKKETEDVLERLNKKYKWWDYVLMSKEWDLLSTEELHKYCRNKDIVFVIWWPFGLNENDFIKIWAKRISFWKITLPHWLAKLTLLEQIYRIWTIESGKSYHY